jgi:hypothetical protein
VELYSLSGLCEAACKVTAEVVCDIYDGGNAESEYPDILDGNGEFVMDGGSAYFTILNYILLSGGSAQTNVCDL